MYLTIALVSIICLLIYFVIYENVSNDRSELYNPSIVPYNNIKKVSKENSNIPVYIINMLNKPDRKEHMIQLMKKLGFKNYTFVVPVPKDEAMNDPIMYGTTLNPSKASNTLTFLRLFQNVPYDKYIIMEDDIDVYNNKISVNDIFNEIKTIKDWDLCYMEFCWENCINLIKKTKNLYKLDRAVCTGATLINKTGAKKILDNFTNKITAKDRFFADLNQKGIIKCFGYPLFRQDPYFGSDLEGSFKFKQENKGKFPKICKY